MCKLPYLSNPACTFYWLGLIYPIIAVILISHRRYLRVLPYVPVFLCGYCFVYAYAGVSLFLLGAGHTLSRFTLSYTYNLELIGFSLCIQQCKRTINPSLLLQPFLQVDVISSGHVKQVLWCIHTCDFLNYCVNLNF